MRAASEAGSYSVPLTQEQKNWFLNGLCLQNILGKIHSLLTNKVCYCLYLESQCSMSKTNCMNWEVHEFLVLTSHILCASVHCSISTLRFILVSGPSLSLFVPITWTENSSEHMQGHVASKQNLPTSWVRIMLLMFLKLNL